jgi:hypothetical protein
VRLRIIGGKVALKIDASGQDHAQARIVKRAPRLGCVDFSGFGNQQFDEIVAEFLHGGEQMEMLGRERPGILHRY